MKIDRHIAYNLKGATSKQRKEFLKLILTDNPKGWNEEAITNFIFDYDEDDCIYFDAGEWLWDSQGHLEDVSDVNIRDMFITRFEYIDENGRNIVARGNFSFQLQDGGTTLKVFKENYV